MSEHIITTITVDEALGYINALKDQFEAKAADSSCTFSDDTDTMLEDLATFVTVQHDLADDAFLAGQ
jgi:hypothetical protein